VSSYQAQRLAERPEVVSVHLETLLERNDISPTELQKAEKKSLQDMIIGDAVQQTNPEYVNADKAWAKGFQGQGYAVAILDDGINAQHEMFTGKIIAQACFSNAWGSISMFHTRRHLRAWFARRRTCGWK
jgi:subtilisin family serine protease